MAVVEVVTLLAFCAILLYKWATAKYDFFKERGIPYVKPVPLLGNIEYGIFTRKDSFLHSILRRDQRFKDSKVYGFFNLRDPIIFVRDLDLIKKIGIKDFDTFPNHKTSFSDKKFNIFARSLIALQDRQWKEMRNTLTPTFTGSKMRMLFQLLNEICVEAVTYIEIQAKEGGNNGHNVEMKEYFTRYAHDIIASIAFGIKVNSYKDKNNEFYVTGTGIIKRRLTAILKGMLFAMIPRIMKALRVRAVDETKLNYFRKLVFDAIKYRKEHHIVRHDMIHLLVEAQRHFEETKFANPDEVHAEFTDEDLLAQCLLFFLAGFDTVSTCLSFTAYELAMNQDAQTRLYEEIRELEKDLDGKPLHYDAVMQMKYMEMVIAESLRKWPPAIATDRICAHDYELKDDDGNVIVKLKKNDQIFIPIVAIHYDSDNYSNPEVFDPERFSEENKKQMNSSTYLPFGLGPRACIGNRLALMETKSILYHLLLKFKLVPAEKTPKDIFKTIVGFTMAPKDDFWLKLIPRETIYDN